MNALDLLRTVTAAAEPAPANAWRVVYRNLDDLHKATLAIVRDAPDGFLTLTAHNRPVNVSLRYRTCIAVTPRGGRHTLELEPSHFGVNSVLCAVDGRTPRFELPKEFQVVSGTPLQYLNALVAYALKSLPQQAQAAAEPEPTGVTPNQALKDLETEANRRGEIKFKVGEFDFVLSPGTGAWTKLHLTCPRWKAAGFYFIDYTIGTMRSARQGTVPKLLEQPTDPRDRYIFVSGDVHRGVNSWKDLLRNASKLGIKHGESEFKRFLKMKKQAEKLQAKAAAEPHSSHTWTMLTLGKALSEENLAHVRAAIPGYTVDFETDFDDGTLSAAITKDGETETYGQIQFFPGYGDLKRGLKRQPPELCVFDVDGIQVHEFNAAAVERTLATAHGDAVSVYTKLLRAVLPQAVAALVKQYGDKA